METFNLRRLQITRHAIKCDGLFNISTPSTIRGFTETTWSYALGLECQPESLELGLVLALLLSEKLGDSLSPHLLP